MISIILLTPPRFSFSSFERNHSSSHLSFLLRPHNEQLPRPMHYHTESLNISQGERRDEDGLLESDLITHLVR